MMHSTRKTALNLVVSVYNNERGAVLAITLMFLGILAAMGSATVVMTRANIKVSDNYKNNEQAFFIAQAGVEHAREELRAINAVSGDTTTYSDELAASAGGNGTLDGYFVGTDDIPLILSGTMADGTYDVFLTNDVTDGMFSTTDTNRTVTLTAVATGPNGSEAIIEMTVTNFDLFPPPAAITLLGPGASFTGNNSNAKELHGDDQCATDPIGVTRPVIAISHLADLPNIQAAVDASKPKTYHAHDASGNDVAADTDPDMISNTIPGSMFTLVLNNYGVNLLDAKDLNAMVKSIEKAANRVVPGGTAASSLFMGDATESQVIVVKGDFHLNDSGAGVLVVTGNLVFNGNINYDGLIFVFGEGSMTRNGAGNGTIRGAVLVANTKGPDGVMGTADDVLGPPAFNTSGGGTSDLHYCSTVINKAITDVPPRAIAFNHVM